LDENTDYEFYQFQLRKATIVTNLTKVANQRYGNDEGKKKILIDQVIEALDEEEMKFKKIRKTIIRKTMKRPMSKDKLTAEQ